MKTQKNYLRYIIGMYIGMNVTYLHYLPNIKNMSLLITLTALLTLLMLLDLGLELKDYIKLRKSKLIVNKEYYIWQNNFVYYRGKYLGIADKTFIPMFKIANGSIIEATYENIYTKIPDTYKHVAIL